MLQALLPASVTRAGVHLKPFSMRSGSAKLRELCIETGGIEPDDITAFLFTNKARDCLLMYFEGESGDQSDRAGEGRHALMSPCASTRVLVAAALALLASELAHALARVERYAVIIGNNGGSSSDATLQYAEADATRAYDVLRELGGFAPANMVLLRDEDAETVRSTLICVNDRIRQAIALPDTQAMLVLYCAGHADAADLHLGADRLAIAEIARLVRGSAADVRLVVLDACGSGALTRRKGGAVKQPFALPDETLPSDGLAFLTASAESEDAQESGVLRGSFFTHAVVSGLLGAADRDGDGAVVLDEAYRYAYAAMLRATSRTFAGTQHPTFRYELSGQGELALTRPEAYAAERAQLRFPSGYGFLVMREHADGSVVAELSDRTGSRTLSLRPGRYFIRARGCDVLCEGALHTATGATTSVDLSGMERIDYAHLVRKGARSSPLAHGLEAGMRVHSALPNTLSELFAAPYTYMNEPLARFFGVSGPAGDAFERVELDPAKHAGVLTEASVMSHLATTDRTHPILRGVFVRRKVLCHPLPDPPAGITDGRATVVDENATERERLAVHRVNPSCAGCHQFIDPVGLAFENFDGTGRWRDPEAGEPVDVSGNLDETDVPGPVNGAIELSHKLAQSEQVRECMTLHWFRFASGRGETPDDACSMARVHRRFSEADGDLRELVLAMTQTDAFLYRTAPEAEVAR